MTHFHLFFVVLLLLVGCVPVEVSVPTATQTATTAAVTPTPVPTLRPTQRPTQTPRAIPSFTPQPSKTPFASPTPLNGAYVADGYNDLQLRSLPYHSGEVIETLAEQTSLMLVGRTDDNAWLQVRTPNGNQGWVPLAFVNVYADLLSFPVAFMSVPVIPTPIPRPMAAGNPGRIQGYIFGITPTSRAIFVHGQQLGNRPNIFSKIGDSITVGTYFFYPIGWGSYNLREYSDLNATLSYFSSSPARDGNSFSNNSLAADNGWTSDDLLDPSLAHPQLCGAGETPVGCEYRVVRPAVALIMIGTNDTAEIPVERFDANLRRIVELSIQMGVIPVLSTIPSRAGFEAQVTQFNGIIARTARAYDVPLWDYWSVMQTLPNQGLSEDGVHPSWPPGDFPLAVDFTAANLRYGYTARNLTGLQALDAIVRGVIQP